MTMQIYTDGSSIGNPGPGGRGAIIKITDHRLQITEISQAQETILSWGERTTTNNVMELTAVIKSLEHIAISHGLWTINSDSGAGLFDTSPSVENTIDEQIVIYTDSTYVQKWVTERLATRVRRNRRRSKGWQLIANLELRKHMHALLPYFANLEWQRVRWHVGHEMNERVDDLARGEAEKIIRRLGY